MNKRIVSIACALAAAYFLVPRPCEASAGRQDSQWLDARTVGAELEAVRGEIKSLEEREDNVQDELKYDYRLVDPERCVLDIGRDYTGKDYETKKPEPNRKSGILLSVSKEQLADLAYVLALRDAMARGDDDKPIRGNPESEDPEYHFWLSHLMNLSEAYRSFVKTDRIPVANKELVEIATRLEALNAREKELSDRLVELRKGKKPGAAGAAVPEAVQKVAGTWKFGRCKRDNKDVNEFICNIGLTTQYVAGKGYKLSSNHVNESFWELQGADIIFKNDKGTVSTTFSPNGTNGYEGPFELDSRVGVRHYLRK